jgi:hypothetical protein
MTFIERRRRTGTGGRPPRASVPSSIRVEFVVTPDEKESMRQVAKQNSLRLSTMIREAVNSFVADCGERVVFPPSGDRFKSPS